MSRPGRSSVLTEDEKIIVRSLWVERRLLHRSAPITKHMIQKALEDYSGEAPGVKKTEAARNLRKNMDNLMDIGKEFVPVAFGHQVLCNVLTD